MSDTNTKHEQQGANTTTEAEDKSIDGRAGKSVDTSHDNKSHTKAGKNEGVGGGKKQERHH